MLWGEDIWQAQTVMYAIIEAIDHSVDDEHGIGFAEDCIAEYDPTNRNNSMKIYDFLDYLHDCMNEFNYYSFQDYIEVKEDVWGQERWDHIGNSVMDFVEDRMPEFGTLDRDVVITNIQPLKRYESETHRFNKYLNNQHGSTEDGQVFYEKEAT